MSAEKVCENCQAFTEDNLTVEIQRLEMKVLRQAEAMLIAQRSIADYQEQAHRYRTEINEMSAELGRVEHRLADMVEQHGEEI